MMKSVDEKVKIKIYVILCSWLDANYTETCAVLREIKLLFRLYRKT